MALLAAVDSKQTAGGTPAAPSHKAAASQHSRASASQVPVVKERLKSVVHPNNPLKRIPVSAAQAMAPVEKASAAKGAAQGPSAMQRLNAAKASLDHKKMPHATASMTQQAAKGTADISKEEARPIMRSGPGTGLKREAPGSSAAISQLAAEPRPIARHASDSNGNAAQLGQVKAKPVEDVLVTAVRTGEKRPHQATAVFAGERQAVKRFRPSDSTLDLRNVPLLVERTGGAKVGAADGISKHPVRPGRRNKPGSKAAAGDVEMFGKHRDRSAARLPPASKASAGLGSPSLKVAHKPAPRPTEAEDDSSSEDEMVLMQRAPARAAAPAARSREAQEHPPRQAAAPDGTGKLSRGGVSHWRRAVSPPPHRRQAGPSAAMRAAADTEGAGQAEKYTRGDQRAPGRLATAAGSAALPWRDPAAQTPLERAPAVQRPGAVRSGVVDAPRGQIEPAIGAVRSVVVTHDVEAQTEPADVRDSSVQTAQLWGRSTGCQADLPRADSEPVQRPCHTQSVSVQCDAAPASGSGPEGGGEVVGHAESSESEIRAAIQALHAVHKVLSPRQLRKFVYHEGELMGILSELLGRGAAVEPAADAADWQEWDTLGGDTGELALHEGTERGSDSASEAQAEGQSQEEAWLQAGTEPCAGDDSLQEAPPSQSEGLSEPGAGAGGHSHPCTPRTDVLGEFDYATCSPDEVLLDGAPFREESPDEAPFEPLHMEGRDGDESDDEVPLMQAAPSGSEQGEDEASRDVGVGAPADGGCNGSPGDGIDDVDAAVVQAAIMGRLRKLLPTADLNVATAKSVRGRLEFSLRRDLKPHMSFIKEAINSFLEDPVAFAVEPAEEAALAGRLVPPAPHRPGGAERGRALPAGGQRGGAEGAGPRERGPQEERVVSAAEKRSSTPDLVGRLNGAIAPKRRGGAALYCQANKSAKERFQTSMTPEQLREAKEAARAGLD